MSTTSKRRRTRDSNGLRRLKAHWRERQRRPAGAVLTSVDRVNTPIARPTGDIEHKAGARRYTHETRPLRRDRASLWHIRKAKSIEITFVFPFASVDHSTSYISSDIGRTRRCRALFRVTKRYLRKNVFVWGRDTNMRRCMWGMLTLGGHDGHLDEVRPAPARLPQGILTLTSPSPPFLPTRLEPPPFSARSSPLPRGAPCIGQRERTDGRCAPHLCRGS